MVGDIPRSRTFGSLGWQSLQKSNEYDHNSNTSFGVRKAKIIKSPNRRQIQRLPVPRQHRLAQRVMLRLAQARVACHDLDRVGAGQLQEVKVAQEVAETQVSQAVLTGAEELAQAAQARVLLGEDEAV